ncbi:hypothetical protein AV530_003084 [Patagioenas fasciata monilis]|uniref:Uncharacterized protein n=1 Tax=Patagioenas fasciata monilis TaxID=372326 RepID=A0A1V4KVV4_PATFA|nr:hypothetical protein AV530_003084 [Patagioenas fasciata monilis]
MLLGRRAEGGHTRGEETEAQKCFGATKVPESLKNPACVQGQRMPSKGRADIVQASDPVPVIYTSFCKLLLRMGTVGVPRDTAAPVILCLDPLSVSSITHSAGTGALVTKARPAPFLHHWSVSLDCFHLAGRVASTSSSTDRVFDVSCHKICDYWNELGEETNRECISSTLQHLFTDLGNDQIWKENLHRLTPLSLSPLPIPGLIRGQPTCGCLCVCKSWVQTNAILRGQK